MRSHSLFALAILLPACAGDPNTVEITLSPTVISSLDGTTTVEAIVANNTTPLSNKAVHATIKYTDRNGTDHAVMPVDGKTDERGVFHTVINGLTWDGTGSVTVAFSDAVSGTAEFSVLDRTPPKVTILPPTTNNHVGPGLPLDVSVHVTDEIGVSKLTVDDTGLGGNGFGGTFTRILASGTTDATIVFHYNVPQGAPNGSTIQLFALASDLSGNLAAAMPITLTVDSSITIATPPGLTGTLLTDGTTSQLGDPQAIAASPKDGMLYVADKGTGTCAGHCIWQVSATTGAVTATPVYIGIGTIQGLAFDATGDNLYFTDRQNRTGRLTYSAATSSYGTPVVCNDITTQRPQDPWHLVFDASLGLLTPDNNQKELTQIATCAVGTQGAYLTNNSNWDDPRGIALGPNGEIYVSDFARDRLSQVDRTTHAVTAYMTQITSPYGLEWLMGGTTAWADHLMVASFDDRIVAAATTAGPLAAAYLRNNPVDLAFISGTMFVITAPSANNRGRIYKVTGF